jgi:hypothetical protein
MASPSAAGPVLSRRSFLAASAAGVALLAAGCTSDASEGQEPVTAAQVDSLAAQVTAQQSLVDAYAAAAAADADLGQEIAPLAEQAGAQLDRLRAASPGSGASPGAASSAAASSSAADGGADRRTWLRREVAATADSHAAACLDQTGARAALLGSIAAGLRGHTVRLG